MAYIDVYEAATDAAHILRKQVAVALHEAAIDVLNESPEEALHAERICWANKVLRDPIGWAAIAIWKVLQNPTIAAAPTTSPDGDVRYVINGLVNVLWRG